MPGVSAKAVGSRWWVALVALAGLWLAAFNAQAQTIQPINDQAFSRDLEFRGTAQKPFWINREDCIQDDVLHFDLSVMNPTDDNFEVWVGTSDCAPRSARIELNGVCWRVARQFAQTARFSIDVPVRDVVARRPSASDPDAQGDIGVCDDNWELSVNFYFMYVNDNGDVLASATWTKTGVDIRGPTPPSAVEARVGDGALLAKWTPSTSTDLLGYNIYCRPTDGVEGDAGVGNAGAGNADAGVTLADAGVTLADAGNGATVAPGSGEETALVCEAPGLDPGTIPALDLPLCGEVTGLAVDSALAKGLDNYREYALAVAAVDDLGNPGSLSNVACAVPEELDTFFERYRELGGRGGGGICSVRGLGQTLPGSSGRLALLGLAAMLALFVFRRQQ